MLIQITMTISRVNLVLVFKYLSFVCLKKDYVLVPNVQSCFPRDVLPIKIISCLNFVLFLN